MITSSTRERRGPRCHSPRPAELNVDRTLRAIHSSACACDHVTRGMCVCVCDLVTYLLVTDLRTYL